MKYRAVDVEGNFVEFDLNDCPVRITSLEFVLAAHPNSNILNFKTIGRKYVIGDKEYFEGDELIDSNGTVSYVLDSEGLCLVEEKARIQPLPIDGYIHYRRPLGLDVSDSDPFFMWGDRNIYEGYEVLNEDNCCIGTVARSNNEFCMKILSYRRKKFCVDEHIKVRKPSVDKLCKVLSMRMRTPISFKYHGQFFTLKGFVCKFGQDIAIESDGATASVINSDNLQPDTGIIDDETGDKIYYGDVYKGGVVVEHCYKPCVYKDGQYKVLSRKGW